MANRTAKTEEDQMHKLSSLLGGYASAQKRIDFDYAAVLFQPECNLPISLLGPLVKRACEVHDIVAAWEHEMHHKKPSEYLTALARKAYYAIGYIVRRFQEDETLRARFHAYKPHLDVIEGYLQQIITKLESEDAQHDDAKELENELEAVFAKLMFTRGQIMCGLIERTISRAKKEKANNTRGSPEHSNSHTNNNHASFTSPNDGTNPAHSIYHQKNASDLHSSQREEKKLSGNVGMKIIDSHSPPINPSPNGPGSTGHWQPDTLKVNYAMAMPMYDTKAEDHLQDEPHSLPSLPSTSTNPPRNPYHVAGKLSSSKSTSAYPTRSPSNISRINSTGYMKAGETSVASERRADMSTFYEEPEEMAPDEYNNTQNKQNRVNGLSRYEPGPQYDQAAAYAHYPPAHHHQPHHPYYPAQYSPAPYQYASPTSPGGWVYPGQMQRPPVHPSGDGVHISHSLNQIGNTTETIIIRDKKKSRASTSKSKRSNHYE